MHFNLTHFCLDPPIAQFASPTANTDYQAPTAQFSTPNPNSGYQANFDSASTDSPSENADTSVNVGIQRPEPNDDWTTSRPTPTWVIMLALVFGLVFSIGAVVLVVFGLVKIVELAVSHYIITLILAGLAAIGGLIYYEYSRSSNNQSYEAI